MAPGTVWTFGEQKSLLPLVGFETQTVGPRSVVATLPQLFLFIRNPEPTEQDGLAPGSVWTFREEKSLLPLVGFETRTVRPRSVVATLLLLYPLRTR